MSEVCVTRAAGLRAKISQLETQIRLDEEALSVSILELIDAPSNEHHVRERESLRASIDSARRQVEDLGLALQHARRIDDGDRRRDALSACQQAGAAAKRAAQQRIKIVQQIDGLFDQFEELRLQLQAADDECHAQLLKALRPLLGQDRISQDVVNGRLTIEAVRTVAAAIRHDRARHYPNLTAPVEQARREADRVADRIDSALIEGEEALNHG